MKKLLGVLFLVLVLQSCEGKAWYTGEWYNDIRVIRLDKEYTGVNLTPFYLNTEYSVVDGILKVNDLELSIKENDDESLYLDDVKYQKYTGENYSIKEVDDLLDGTWDGQVLKLFIDKDKKTLSMNGVGLFSSLSKETVYTLKDVLADWAVLERSADGGVMIIQIKDSDNIVLKGRTPEDSVLLSREK